MKLTCTLLALSLFAWLQGAPSWPVPEAYTQLRNPIESSSTSVAIGKALFRAHCRSCHHSSDGKHAANQGEQAPLLSSSLMQNQAAGALFYKIREGRNGTHVFKYQIPSEEDAWHLVNYLHSL
jgi:mono/diheme cytochrome c family protein